MAPITLIKNDLVYPIEKLGTLETPFSFKISDTRLMIKNEFLVDKGERPIYFVRKRMNIVGGRVKSNYIYRYCIGVIKNNTIIEKHWIMPNGEYDTLNTEPNDNLKVI